MNILSINYSINHRSVRQIKFLSNSSLLDADVILWNIDQTFDEFQTELMYTPDGGAVLGLDKNYFNTLEGDLEKRKTDFYEFFSHQRILILQTPIISKKTFPVRDFNTDTIEEREIDLLSLIGIGDLGIIKERGELVTLSENLILQNFSRNGRLVFKYEAKFKTAIGEPLLYINKTKYVVGQLIRGEYGDIVLLPPLLYDNDEFTYQTFVDGIRSLTERIPARVRSTDVLLPDWVKKINLKGELSQRQKRTQLTEELENLHNKIGEQDSILKDFESLKILLCGSGEALESIAEKVFKELGFVILEKEVNRDDLIMTFGEEVAVVEIKGVKGSASERNAAQLEKWVANHIDRRGVIPKGLLLVNAFKDTPINERKERAFPDQMLKYSISREHCLLTGNDLLNLFMDFKEEKLSGEEIAKMLFDTVGVLNYDTNKK